MALTGRGLQRLRQLAASAVLVVGLGPAAAVAAAAGPSVSAPTVTFSFLTEIHFNARVTDPSEVDRVEMVIDVEGSSRSFVATIESPPASGFISYGFGTPGGSLLPGSDVTGHVRLHTRDGTTIDGPATTIRYEDDRYGWEVLSGEHVTVRWTEGGSAFGRRARDIGDKAVEDVSRLLGVTETEPIDFYVYADRTAFYDVLGPGSRENVGGEAHPDIRALFANIAPSQIDAAWVSIVIPHELTHLVFDTAVANPYHYPPRWLNEGLAVYLSEGFTADDRGAVIAAAGDGSLMPLRALTGQFPTTADRFFLAYSESVAAIDFLIREYGQPALVDLVTSYASGVTDDEAFQAALGVDTTGFEAAWLASLGAPLPSPFGPGPAPAGPVPPGWSTEVAPGGPTAGPSTGPLASPAPGAGGGSGDGLDGGVLVAGLVVVGILVGGLILVLRRANRPAAP